MVYCSKCGHPNQDGSAFCSKCGAKLDETATTTRSASDVRRDIVGVDRPEPKIEGGTRTAADVRKDFHEPEPTPAPSGVTPKHTASSPPKKDRTSLYAVAAVIIVLIAAVGIGAYYMAQDDGGDDGIIPEDHPLYGVVTPDGTYTYHGTLTYQGQTIDATLVMGLKNEQYTKFTLNGESLSQSELDEINETMKDTSVEVELGEPQRWNDGDRAYYVYPMSTPGETDYVATNGYIVYIEMEMDGMVLKLTLDGWSKGEVYVDTTCEVSFWDQKGVHILTETVNIGDKIEMPDMDIEDGYAFVAFRNIDTGRNWDFENDTVQGDLCLEAMVIQHFTFIIDWKAVVLTTTLNTGTWNNVVDWGDGTTSNDVHGKVVHIYDDFGTYTITVHTTSSKSSIESSAVVVISG